MRTRKNPSRTRQKTEPVESLRAYRLFREMGPGRSLKQLADMSEFSLKSLQLWNTRWKWGQRLRKEMQAEDRALTLAYEERQQKKEIARVQEIEITSARTLRELAKIAYADIRGAIEWAQKGKWSVEDLTEETAAAIDSIEVVKDPNGNLHTKVRLRVNEKLDAIKQLGTFQELFKSEKTPEGNENLVFLQMLEAYRSGHALQLAEELVRLGVLPEHDPIPDAIIVESH